MNLLRWINIALVILYLCFFWYKNHLSLHFFKRTLFLGITEEAKKSFLMFQFFLRNQTFLKVPKNSYLTTHCYHYNLTRFLGD